LKISRTSVVVKESISYLTSVEVITSGGYSSGGGGIGWYFLPACSSPLLNPREM
jgi:hypothetical protein